MTPPTTPPAIAPGLLPPPSELPIPLGPRDLVLDGSEDPEVEVEVDILVMLVVMLPPIDVMMVTAFVPGPGLSSVMHEVDPAVTFVKFVDPPVPYRPAFDMSSW